MKLSQMFSGKANSVQTKGYDEQVHTQSARNTAAVNRQIRSLAPGQTVSGEIVGRSGGEVQIRLTDDLVLNARVDRSLNIELGKNMTFEVKSNGSALTLSPLFTNVATDVNVLKALDMAGLPVNEASVEMTEKLMEAGLPVNRNTLMQVYREINSFPQAQISDIVDLHRLQMPVNEENINQMAAYRSLSHQLLQGMEAVTDALPEVFQSLQESGDAAGAVKLYQELFLLVQEGGEDVRGEDVHGEEAAAEIPGQGQQLPAEESAVQGEGAVAENRQPGGALSQAGEAGNPVQENLQSKVEISAVRPEFIPENTENSESAQIRGEEAVREAQDPVTVHSEVPQAMREAVAKELHGMLEELQLSPQQAQELADQINGFAAGKTVAGQLMASMNELAQDVSARHLAGVRGREMEVLAKAFSGAAFRELLSAQIKEKWTISPEDVAGQGKVEELYRRLDRQLKSLAQALDNTGQTASNAFKAVTNLTQNLDFMQQINQMYAYVQLPLKLQQGEAHGDLYVYTNKRHLAQADGQVSALLHLDMEHLGPVDVYVTLQNSRVNTSFKVRDDEMLDFLSQHMELLTERLKKRGYDCSYSMTTRDGAEDGNENSGIEPILRQEKGVSLVHYAFDVRT